VKVEASAAERFAAEPPRNLFAILVFGADQGLVRERADRIARTAVSDLGDPFRTAELLEDALSESPGRLREEAAAIPMLGGKRVVRVRGASNSHAGLFEAYLESPVKDALVVVEAGDLSKSSSLHRVFAEAAGAAAVPCYLDTPSTLEGLIRETLEAAGFSLDPAALAEATSRLGSDRALTRRELEKLVLYASGEKQITREHVLAVFGDESELRMEAVCDAAGEGDYVRLDRQLARLWETGVTPVAMTRVALAHFQRLLLMRAKVDSGTAIRDLVESARPPVHFRRKRSLQAQIARWNVTRLEQALVIFYEAEVRCKTTGVPAEAAIGRTLLEVASIPVNAG
jgi:DNA polymerase-3 subunit delta